MTKKAPETIIISRPDGIGDVIFTLPMAGIFKKAFPECKIVFLGQNYTMPIIEKSLHVDTAVSWSEIEKKAASEQLEFFKSLGADAIVHVFPHKKIAKLAKRAGIQLRIGTSHRIFHWFQCNKLINLGRKKSDLHEAQLNIQLLKPFDIKTQYQRKEIDDFYGIPDKIKVNDVDRYIDSSKFNLILHPKSKGSAREWGFDNFERLIHLLPQDKFKIFLTGSPDESKIIKKLADKCSDLVTDVSGKFTLSEFISFISLCDGLVAASTGPLHIAAATNKVTVGIFAPMRPIFPTRWEPLGKKAEVLVKEKDCEECRNSTNCKCITSIQPEDVKKRLEKHL